MPYYAPDSRVHGLTKRAATEHGRFRRGRDARRKWQAAVTAGREIAANGSGVRSLDIPRRRNLQQDHLLAAEEQDQERGNTDE